MSTADTNIIDRNIVDMHCDTISRLLEEKDIGFLRSNEGHLDLLRMQRQGYLLQNFALFVDMGRYQEPWQQVQALLARYEQELKDNADLIAPVRCYDDIESNRLAGKMSALLTVEEGGVCQGEVSRLGELYDRGVRMMTITWNYPNELGCPNWEADHRKRGLTPLGRCFVEEMERLGIIPDVSHLSDAGFYDVLAVTKKPFVASHSNARAVCSCARNMTDEMIRALAERGGVMGLNYCADFLTRKAEGEHNPGTVWDIVCHAKHIVKVGGMEVLGLGSDFDGIDTHEELVGVQGMGKLWEALKRGGFHESQIEKIFNGNVLRVYRECL